MRIAEPVPEALKIDVELSETPMSLSEGALRVAIGTVFGPASSD